MLALRLPKEIEDRLAALAKKTGRTKNFYAREAILEHLDDLEDAFLADSRMKNDPEFVSLEQSMSELNIADNELDQAESDR